MEGIKLWLFLFFLFGGGTLCFGFIHLGWELLKKPLNWETSTPEYIAKQESRTKHIRDWTHDNMHGGPLKGTPRPLTLDEKKHMHSAGDKND